MSLDYALRQGPQPEKTVCFPMFCPMHTVGDEARLDYREHGWDGRCASTRKRHVCRPTWRVSFLCDRLIHEYYCERELPQHLRALTR